MSNTLFDKGNYKPIDRTMLADCVNIFQKVARLQKKYKKYDMDSFFNEIHDSMVGSFLGFELVNTEKHGFDCKLSSDKNIYLESKVASFNVKDWTATFNDTTYEKADAFKDNRLWLALSVWISVSEPLCICYGQNPMIGDFLREKVDNFKDGQTVRSTQSISFSSLVFRYGFKILTINKSPDELYTLLNANNHAFSKLDKSSIVTLRDYHGLE